MLESLVGRMIRAIKLDVDLYNEVEADKSATSQALLVVVIAAVASAIGALLQSAIQGTAAGGALVSTLISSLVGWVLASVSIYLVGVHLFGGKATLDELLRTLGFAYSIQVLNILTFIPVIGRLIGFAVTIWWLVMTVVAAREALDLDTGKAVATCIIGGIIWVVFLMVMGLVFGAGAFIVGSLV